MYTININILSCDVNLFLFVARGGGRQRRNQQVLHNVGLHYRRGNDGAGGLDEFSPENDTLQTSDNPNSNVSISMYLLETISNGQVCSTTSALYFFVEVARIFKLPAECLNPKF